MAIITFTGPNPANPTDGTSVTTAVTLPDEALLMAVQGLCMNHGYQAVVPNPTPDDPNNPDPDYQSQIANPTGPGTFAIQQTIEFWKREGQAYQEQQAVAAARAAVAAAIAPLTDKITITTE